MLQMVEFLIILFYKIERYILSINQS